MEVEEEGKEEEEVALYQYQEEKKKPIERYFTWKEKMEKETEK